MIEALTQMAASIEDTEGAAETLEAADAFLAANFKFTPGIAIHKRENTTSSLSKFAAIPGARQATMEFDVEMKGSGTAGTAPEWGKLLKACGFGESVTTSTSVKYYPASSGISSLTIAGYENGMIHKMWGARGNVSLKCEDGAPCWLHFVFTGADFSTTDGALLTGVSYHSTKPLPFLNASLTIDSYAALIGTLDIDMGNKVVLRQDVSSVSGHKSAVITNREPSMTIDPEKVLVATYDFYGKLRSGNEGALSFSLYGAAGNIATITAPKVQYTELSEDSNEGLRKLGITCQLNRNAGDDEIVIDLA